MKRTFYGTAAVWAILMAAAGTAFPERGQFPGEAVIIEVVSDSRGVLQSIPADGTEKDGAGVIRRYVEAQRGENYGVLVRNNTPGRIGVVIAVDGRNIIDGKRSHLRNREAMYVVNGYGSGRYDGWRTSSQEVHRFVFTDTPDSYSVRTFKDSSALGVIAVAVYREKEQTRQYQKREDQARPAAPRSKAGADRKQDESAATGFGDALYSPVVTVQFEPEAGPIQKTFVKYEWRETLCRNGIVPCGSRQKNRFWDGEGYAPFPPGYPRS